MANKLFFTTQAGAGDTFLTFVNVDGTNLVSHVPDATPGSPWQEVVIDAAENRYFIFQYDQNSQTGVLYTGQLNSSAAPTVAFTFQAEDLVGGLEIDTVNNKLYLSRTDFDGSFNVQNATTGILAIDYNPATGVLSNTSNFLVTQASDPLPAGPGFPQGFILATDMARDDTDGTLYFARSTAGAQTNMIYRVDTSNNISTLLNQTQFPINFSNGFIADVDVDAGRNLVYFSTYAQPFAAGPTNRLWVISDTATGSTNATAVTLTGMPGGATFIPGDFTIDQATHQLYVESEENPAAGNSDDLIYRFQLSGDGLTATFLNVIDPPLTSSDANIGGLEFVGNTAAALDLDANNSAGIGGTGYQATFTEGGAAVAAADTDTTITDDDANAVSVTITLTNRQAGDLLSINGVLPGGIVASAYNAGTGVLTLTGSATLGQYQTALRQVVFSNSSDAPSTVDRSITVTVNDGLTDGNTATATIHVAAVDDAGVAQDDSFATNEATALTAGNVFSNNGFGADADPDSTLTVTAVNGVGASVGNQITLASGALLTLNANGTFAYDPNGAFDDLPASGSGAVNPTTGQDSFSYTLAGGDTATVTVTVSGLDGDGDILIGDGSANTLQGGIGADQMTGLAGNDIYRVDNIGDVADESVAGSNGVDRVFSSISFSLVTVGGVTQAKGFIEGVVLIGAADTYAYGNAAPNTLVGSTGSNLLAAGAGNDILAGRGGNDFFLFNTALNATTNVDTITDMNEDGDDTIQLENAVFRTLSPGALRADFFCISTTGALDANDQIIYNDVTGELFYDNNGNAGGGSTLFARLDTGLALTAADFAVV